ncbi:MAG TPA: RidA family protein [Steroidobacteraceae bacterium]|nr:RidA family protein [Steroidobacteraceae bacterium]
MREIRALVAANVAAPNGHYSHAMAHGDVLYLSGQLGRGPDMSDADAGDIHAQARRCLANIAAILKTAGVDMSNLLKVTVYITDVDHWPAVDAEYRRALGDHRPARAVVPVGPMHYGSLIEIDAIAAL